MPAVLLAFALPVLALQDPAPEGGSSSMWPSIVMFGTIGAIFYFLLIRPQSRAEKERRTMLDALKKKDRVVTSGGLLGIVADIRDDEITLRVSENPDVKVRVRRSSVVEVQKETAEPSSK
jgi:preprotein translocase subunit YajC